MSFMAVGKLDLYFSIQAYIIEKREKKLRFSQLAVFEKGHFCMFSRAVVVIRFVRGKLLISFIRYSHHIFISPYLHKMSSKGGYSICR